jgi:hypothetical protein
MISLRTYGHSGLSSSAYYHFGIFQNFQKFQIAGAVVEASWLEGHQVNFGAPLSNLPKRPVDAYTNVTNTGRFGILVDTASSVVPLLLGKLPVALPGTQFWTLFA